MNCPNPRTLEGDPSTIPGKNSTILEAEARGGGQAAVNTDNLPFRAHLIIYPIVPRQRFVGMLFGCIRVSPVMLSGVVSNNSVHREKRSC